MDIKYSYICGYKYLFKKEKIIFDENDEYRNGKNDFVLNCVLN